MSDGDSGEDSDEWEINQESKFEFVSDEEPPSLTEEIHPIHLAPVPGSLQLAKVCAIVNENDLNG